MAADYTQYDSIQKRVRYFDGQFLKDEDFVDEQKYHIDRQRRPLRFLYSSGIVDGLAVKPGSQKSQDEVYSVVVQPGTAIDSQGRQIVLGSVKDVALLTEYRNQSIEVFIAYQQVVSDLAPEGGESHRRWYEEPEITVQKVEASKAAVSLPGDAIRLARLHLDDQGNVAPDTDLTVRQYAGVKFPTADGANLSLRSRGLAGRSWATLSGSLNITERVGIGTTDPTAKLEVKLASGSTDTSLKLNHNSSNLVVRPLSADDTSSVIENTAGALLINPSGANVGIGSNEATNRLHISGTTGIRQNYLYLSGNVGNSSLSYNAHRTEDNSGWVFPDPDRASVALELDDKDKTPRFEVSAKVNADTGWVQRLALDGSTGNFAIAQNGGAVGIGTEASTAKLTVAASTEHLRLIRNSTETESGTKLFLELVQDATPSDALAVFPAIRFRHEGRFWHRIEAQPSIEAQSGVEARPGGIHFKDGNPDSDTYVRIFAENMIETGMIVMWSGAANAIPRGWALCNGENGTPDLCDRFIVGAGRTYQPKEKGGADTITLNTDQIPSHNHGVQFDSDEKGGYGNIRNLAKASRSDDSFANFGVLTDQTGGNQSHENRPPYYALCFIMKT